MFPMLREKQARKNTAKYAYQCRYHSPLSAHEQREQLGRHKGGRELLAAVGFCDELRAEAGQRDRNIGRAAQRSDPLSKKKVAAVETNGGQVGRRATSAHP